MNYLMAKSPYLGWLTDLDIKIAAIIEKRIARIRLGNFGDCETLSKMARNVGIAHQIMALVIGSISARRDLRESFCY